MRSRIILLVALQAPATLSAQIPLVDKLFENLEDVNAAAGIASLISERDVRGSSLSSVTFEVTFVVAKPGCRNATESARSHKACGEQRRRDSLETVMQEQCEISDNAEPSKKACEELSSEREWETVERTTTERDGKTRVSIRYEPADAGSVATTPLALVEFGLSYAQYKNFESADSTIDLSGTVEELPGPSSHASFDSRP